MRILRIGDPHVKVNNLDEMEAFMHWLTDLMLKVKPDRLEILGDLFHTHAILRIEVIDFWNSWLDTLSDICEVFVLVGNHDLAGPADDSLNALSVFNRMRKKNLKIVELARQEGIFGYVPYIHDRERFVTLANGLASSGSKILVCHQTFNGSQYENGFYAPDGLDPNLVAFDLIISGHIHKRQRFATPSGRTIIYPGTFKWDTASDANEEKGIWLVEHDNETGKILSEEFIDTSVVCKPIIKHSWAEGEECPVIKEGSRTTIELVGTSDWVGKQKELLKGKVSVTSKITDRAKRENRQSGTSVEDFIKNHFVTSVDKEKLIKYMGELGLV